MGGHEQDVLIGFQAKLQQVPGVEAEDGTSVGADVPPQGFDFFLDSPHRLEPGREYQVVYLPYPVTVLVDGTDLGCQEKTGRVFRCPVPATGVL